MASSLNAPVGGCVGQVEVVVVVVVVRLLWVADCVAADGTTVGVDIKAAFHYCTGGCNGSTGMASIKLLGSFTLTKVYPNGDNKVSPPIDKAQIMGYFNPVQSPGPVGTVGSTQVKIILVK